MLLLRAMFGTHGLKTKWNIAVLSVYGHLKLRISLYISERKIKNNNKFLFYVNGNDI